MMVIASVRAALVAVLVALAPGLALAGPHVLAADGPVVEVTVPDEWRVVKTTHALEASTRRQDAVVTFMLVGMAEFTKAMKTWEDWAARSGIRLDEAGKSVRKFQFEGHDSISHQWNGVDANGPTIVTRAILKLSEERLLFVTTWAGEQARRDHADALQSIRRSVTKLK